jgi:hypothetical protein
MLEKIKLIGKNIGNNLIENTICIHGDTNTLSISIMTKKINKLSSYNKSKQ